MKKIVTILFMAVLVFMLACPDVFAAVTPGTRTVTEDKIVVEGKHSKKTITVAWVGSVDNGSIPDTTLSSNVIRGWYLFSAETKPGTVTPPTTLFDIVINDSSGLDIASSLLMNRSRTVAELVNIGMGAFGYPLIRGDLTVVFTNQTDVSATGTLILTFVSE